MQESLNLFKVLSDACTDMEVDIVEIKDHFDVMGKNVCRLFLEIKNLNSTQRNKQT